MVSDMRVVVESAPDKFGKQRFTMMWKDESGVFRPELSLVDGEPVGYRRGQCFHAAIDGYLSKFRAEGVEYLLEDRTGLL